MMMEIKKLFEDLTGSINNYIDTMHEGLIKVKAFFEKIEQECYKENTDATTTLDEETTCAKETSRHASLWEEMEHSKLSKNPEIME
jgi:hypothetical protein